MTFEAATRSWEVTLYKLVEKRTDRHQEHFGVPGETTVY